MSFVAGESLSVSINNSLMLRLKAPVMVMLFAFLLTACADQANDNAADDPVPPSPSFELVFSEEFDGTELDETLWEIELGDGRAEGLTRWGNGEEQFYSADNIRVEDGDLVITSRAEEIVVEEIDGNSFITSRAGESVLEDIDDNIANPGTYGYTSGRLRTQGQDRFEFAFGRIEARIKMPAAQGIWSAFWLLASDPSPYIVWAAKGEIDIIETYARGTGLVPEPFASGAVHFGGPFPFNLFDTQSTLDYEELTGAGVFPNGFDFFSDYHVYALEWDDEEIRWYIDGINFYSVKTTNFYSLPTDIPTTESPNNLSDTFKYSSPNEEQRLGVGIATSETAPFDSRLGQRFHILLNSAVGGSLPEVVEEPPSVDDPLLLEGDEMRVDWVRVYRCNMADEEGFGGAACRNFEGRRGIALPEDPRNPGETILPNFTNVALSDESIVYDVFGTGFDLFVDGPDAEQIPDGPEFFIRAFNDATWETVLDPELDSTVIRALASPTASGAQGISFVADEDVILAGATSSVNNLVFDLYIEDEFNGTAVDDAYLSTGGPGNGPRIARIAITSGENNQEGDFLFLPLDEIGAGNWRRFILPLNFIINDGNNFGAGAADLGDINRLIELAFAGVNLRIDNVYFNCAGAPCGVVGGVEVFIDDIDPIWDRGIVGDDTFERFRIPSNADYTDPDCCHVQWDVVELPAGELDFNGEPRGNVVESRFGTTGIFGAVNFIGASNAFPAIGALTNGEFSFDIRVTRNDENAQLLFKIDGDNSSTEEQSLGDLPLNEWRSFSCPISTLAAQGLDTTRITAPFIIVPGNRGSAQGITVQWDNVRFSPRSTGNPVNLALPLEFEMLPAFCLPISVFAGGGFNVIDNPLQTVGNGNNENSSPRVAQVSKFDTGLPDQTFGGVAINLSAPLMLPETSDGTGKEFTIKTFARRLGLPVEFKLECDVVDLTRVFATTVVDEWETHTIDFNGVSESTCSRITIILDNGVQGDGSSDFQLEFDQINQDDANSDIAEVDGMTVYNFDEENTVYPLTDFGEARSSVVAEGPADDLGNIVSDGRVGRVFLGSFATSFAGTILGGLEGFPSMIPFTNDRTTIQMDVWVPRAFTQIELKAEDAIDAAQSASVFQTAPTAGWNTLIFDFSTASINVDDSFEKLTVIFEPGVTRTGQTYYFDNLQLLP